MHTGQIPITIVSFSNELVEIIQTYLNNKDYNNDHYTWYKKLEELHNKEAQPVDREW